jgi:hypothetical protein
MLQTCDVVFWLRRGGKVLMLDVARNMVAI